ncbi:MAG: hypothetical protein ACKOW9_01490 [Candidatus Paceibacterota bacterium]
MDLIIFPDYNGERYKNFSKTLSDLYPKKTILAVLNGPNIPDSEPLQKISDNVLTMHSAPGYNNALVKALEYAITQNYQNIIKLDTEEHDPLHLPHITALLTNHLMVVSDLTFTEETLPIHSNDYLLNKITMPNLTSKYSRLRLKLTGAHGFFGITQKALRQSMPKITKIHNKHKDTIHWGIDTALIVDTVNNNNPYKVISQPAKIIRDRPLSKIEKQFSDTKTLLSEL